MVGPSAARMAHAERTPNTPSRSPTTARSYSPRAGSSPPTALRFRVHSPHGAGVGGREGDANLGQGTFTARNRPPTPYTSGVGIAVTPAPPPVPFGGGYRVYRLPPRAALRAVPAAGHECAHAVVRGARRQSPRGFRRAERAGHPTLASWPVLCSSDIPAGRLRGILRRDYRGCQ